MKTKFKSIFTVFGKLGILSAALISTYSANAQSARCFEETSSGVIAIEAEGYFSQEKTSKREWFVIGNGATTPKPDPDGSHVGDASGGRYIEVLPDTRVVGHSGPGPEDPIVRGENFSDNAGELAVLNYKVNFKSAGKYFVWARLYSTGPEDNSIHVGINNTWPKSGERMQWCEGKRNWTWESKQRTKDEHCGVARQIFIDVPSAGEHTFQISMREDGVELDKLILSKSYTKPTGKGPAAKSGNCSTTTANNNTNNNNDSCKLPTITNKSSIAVVADGNSPDPDDIGATAVSLALLKAFGLEKDLVYYSHSCDLDPFSGSRNRITPQQELNRQRLMQTSCDGTASRWGGFNGITFYNCRTQRKLATDKLRDAINAATSTKPLAIILAGEPDLIYDAINSAQRAKRKFVTIISHHIANEESADEAGKNISDVEKKFSEVTVTRIPDQNVGLKTELATWHWARDHKDNRIEWLWEQGKIAEQDGVVKFQDGDFDCSDAGMVYFQITGDRTPGVNEFRNALLCYVDGNTTNNNNGDGSNVAPTVSVTSPGDNATFEIGETITLSANASDTNGNLDKVNFKINGDFYKTVGQRPFTTSFTPDKAGTYQIAAKAIDKEGLSIEKFVTITVNEIVQENQAPTVTVTSPLDGDVFELGETINLNSNATDPDGNLDKVNFIINGDFFKTVIGRPFETAFTPENAGSYVITAKAIDKEGKSSEKSITITINEVKRVNQEPTVTITSPLDGNIFQLGEAIDLGANATDPDGNLDKVNFKINDNFYRTDNQRPFTNSFTPDSPGTYKIAVRAFDKEGLFVETFVTITVDAILANEDFDKNETLTKVNLYPSPTSSILNISGLNNESTKATVINTSGRVLFNTTLNSKNSSIPVSQLANGLYFLRLQNDTSSKTITFVKN